MSHAALQGFLENPATRGGLLLSTLETPPKRRRCF